MSAAVSIPETKRICGEDGAVHFSHLKQMNKSAGHYLDSVNATIEPTRNMRVSTGVHQILLGPRSGKEVVVYSGERRAGKEWDRFELENDGRDILTQPEWRDAQSIARLVERDPMVQACLDGARTEVPLTWKDGDVLCSTSGIDIVRPGEIGDLKGATTVQPDVFMRAAFRMSYHCQLAYYRRGCIANGIDVSRGCFVLGYEFAPPHWVVPLKLTPELLDLGDRTLTLWLEKYRACRDANEWPGYTQAPVIWDVPVWLKPGEEEDDNDELFS